MVTVGIIAKIDVETHLMFISNFFLSVLSKKTRTVSPTIPLCQDAGVKLDSLVHYLPKEEISLLTSLKHPNLLRYYVFDVEGTYEIVYDCCEFDSFPELDFSKIALDAHDLWSIRNQILQALKYLASHGLYHKGLNVSNILVCSLYPIKVKLSLFPNLRLLIGPVNTEIPVQEFWKWKMNKQEEVCFDDLIRSIVKSVFPYSIMDNNIVFTNPNTLERDDLESLKALICSIESQCIGDLSNVNNNLSFIFKSFNSQEQETLFFTNALLFHVFTQGIFRYRTPLVEFDIDNCLFECKCPNFANFATKLISISLSFRNLFLRAFDFACSSAGHCLVIGEYYFNSDFIMSSNCSKISQLSNLSLFYLNWLKKFPVTSITTSSLDFDTGVFDTEKVTNLELEGFYKDLAAITLFPNLSSFSLTSSDEDFHDFYVLTCCCDLSTISISRCNISDLIPFSFLEQVCSFSLHEVSVSDFSPLSTFKRLTKLSLSDCNFTDLSVLSPLQRLQELSLNGNDITDVSLLPSLTNLRVLSLNGNSLTNLNPLSCLQFLEKLELNDNKITDISPLASLENLVDLSLDDNRITDISPLSSLFKLEKLSLKATKVLDLWPLKNLTKLSTLDLSLTLLPRIHQKLLTNSFEVTTLINSFEHGVELDFSNHYDNVNLAFYSHCSRLKSLNLSRKGVDNIVEISKFTNLETLDLSNVKLPDNNKIIDISFLSSCINLKSLTLDGSKVAVLGSLSLLVKLESLSLKDTTVFDLWPLTKLSNLSTLIITETLLPREHQRKLTHSLEIKTLINSFEHVVFGLDFSNYYGIVDLSQYSHCSRLKSLNLSTKRVRNISEISKFTNLETLDLSNVKLGYNTYGAVRVTDISFLSSCINLKSLSLDGSNVTDLSPLSLLVELECLSLKATKVLDFWPLNNLTKLSNVDLRETLVPRKFQRIITNSSVIKVIINS
ncbi:hypothetical protein RCL1_007357 [Eukaryota sp. TZLM3-RCL]